MYIVLSFYFSSFHTVLVSFFETHQRTRFRSRCISRKGNGSHFGEREHRGVKDGGCDAGVQKVAFPVGVSQSLSFNRKKKNITLMYCKSIVFASSVMCSRSFTLNGSKRRTAIKDKIRVSKNRAMVGPIRRNRIVLPGES